MKRLLSGFIVTALVAALAVPALAQAPGPKPGDGKAQAQARGMRTGGIHDDLVAKLNLSAAQKTKIEALKKKNQDAVKKLMGNGADREKNRDKMRELMESSRKEFLAILTPAQRTQYEQLVKAEMEKRRAEWQKANKAGKPAVRAGDKPKAGKP